MAVAPAAARQGRLPRRSLGGVPAEGRLAVPDVVRVRPRPTGAAGGGGVRPARAAPRGPEGGHAVATPGCHVTAATLALAPLVAGRVDRADRRDRQLHHRGQRRRAGAEAHLDVLHGRRGRHRLRPARPPAHARDRAGDRRAGAVHPAPRSAEPRAAGHLLRPAGRRRHAQRRCWPPSPVATATNRSSSSAEHRRRPRRRSAATWPTSPRASTSAPTRSSRSARSTTSPRAPRAARSRPPTSPSACRRPPGLAEVGLYP